jgi:transcription-repair coupling factor (superfamily II helicase)
MNTAKSVNPDELNVGDYVVHRKYGIGKFTRFETIEVKGEKQPHYIVEFADGKTAVAIAQENEKILSRYRSASNQPPKLNSIANTKAWDNALSKCRKEIYKLGMSEKVKYRQTNPTSNSQIRFFSTLLISVSHK